MVAMTVTLVLVLMATAPGGAAPAPPARVDVSGGALLVQPLVSADSIHVTLTGPNGFALSRTFGRGEAPVLPLAENGAPADGTYFYEVRLSAAPARERGAAEAGGGDRPQAAALVQWGHVNVSGGVATLPDPSAREPRAAAARGRAAGEAPAPAPQPDDFFINDDLIVVGSGCLGFDCIDNEPFGFENLLLKQNNNRIKADDTSVSGGFPNNDWQIRFNDDAGGGLNRFAVEDLTNARIPMTILAGAPNNSLFVDSSGRLGVRTGAPAQTIHAVTGDTPDLRLEQDGSSGFSPQTWDVAGNESNFFIRDVTGGSTLPFRLRPGAPSSSLDILGPSGNVGVGTGAPAASLHVFRNNATAQLRVEEATATTGSRNMLRIVNNGASTFRFDNTFSGSIWGFGSLGTGNFFIGNTPGQPLAMQITPAGNMIITGTYSSTSDRKAKADIVEVDPGEVLAKVAELPVSTWRFKQADERHMGPMAQDFAAAFGLGSDDTHIAPTDVGGVALAAIKALKQQLDGKDAQIRELNERLAALEAKLAQTSGQ
jgi:hypothetical protein